MTIIVLTACPERLRGYLTRWLMEVSAGVFVGHVTRRVRDDLWARVVDLVGSGRALMVYSATNEQRLQVVSHGHDWEPEDVEGLVLMRRPSPASAASSERVAERGWSSAAGRRRGRRPRSK